MKRLQKAQIGWVMYDFANTIFSMNIVTFFFPLWIINTKGVEDIYYSLAYSASMIAVAVTMPSLGRRADRQQNKLNSLRFYTYAAVFCTIILAIVALYDPSPLLTVVIALISFAFANYFFEGGLTFYNSLLADVSHPANVGKISGIGVAVGYLGAIVGLLLLKPLTDGSLIAGMEGRHYAFLPTAILFSIFAIPTFLWVKERKRDVLFKPKQESFFQSFKQALKETKKYPGVLRFLICDYLIEDAIATVIIFMSIYAEAVTGLDDSGKIMLFVISTLFAFGGALLFGYLSDFLRPKRALLIAISGWVVILAYASIIKSEIAFYFTGVFVGIFLGAVWTTSRPLLNSLVPQDKLGQFYGLYTLSGRAAATIGPLIWGGIVLYGKQDKFLGRFMLDFLQSLGVEITTSLAGNIQYRLALFSLFITMLLGLVFFFKVPDKQINSANFDN